MRNLRVPLLLICILLLSSVLSADLIYVVNSESRTLSRINTVTGTTDNSFAALGLVPNLLCLDEDNIYITCSGDNAVQVIDRENGQLVRFIGIASSSNPWAVIKHGNYLYVTGLMTNKVYRIDLATSTVTGQQAVGVSPEGMAVCGNKLYVANSGGWASGYAGSSVSVIDLESFAVITTIPVSLNPQYLKVHEGFIHVACTGNWTTVSGHIDIIDTAVDEVVNSLPLGGNPGAIWIDNNGIAYVGEGMSTGCYRYNASELTLLNDVTNPLTPGGIAVTGDQDDLYVLDQNWGSGGRLFWLDRYYHLREEYNLGLVPTDFALYSAPVSVTDDLIPSSLLTVYPNPIGQNGTLQVKSEQTGTINFEIFNLRGQRVLHTNVTKGTARLSLRNRELSPGVYFFRAAADRELVLTGKILIYPDE